MNVSRFRIGLRRSFLGATVIGSALAADYHFGWALGPRLGVSLASNALSLSRSATQRDYAYRWLHRSSSHAPRGALALLNVFQEPQQFELLLRDAESSAAAVKLAGTIADVAVAQQSPLSLRALRVLTRAAVLQPTLSAAAVRRVTSHSSAAIDVAVLRAAVWPCLEQLMALESLSFAARLDATASVAELSANEALRHELLTSGAVRALQRVLSMSEARSDASALLVHMKALDHEGDGAAGVALARNVSRAIAELSKDAAAVEQLLSEEWLTHLGRWACNPDKRLRLNTARTLAHLSAERESAIVVLQQLGTKPFEALTDIVDVDVQDVVEQCLAQLAKPDEKLGRLETSEAEEFIVDAQFRLQRKQRNIEERAH